MPSVSSLEQASELLRAAAADGRHGADRSRPRRVRHGPRARARGGRPHVHGRGGHPAVCPRDGARRGPASGCRSIRPAIRRSAPVSQPTSRARSGIGSAVRATSCSASRSSSPTARSSNAGGKVVKNVAGYDLGKLVCGSLGRLAFIGRVSLRLHPAPADSATVVVETDDPAAVAAALLASHLVPSALDVLHPGRVAVLYEGGAAAVAAQVEATRALVGGNETDGAVWAESHGTTGRGARKSPFRARRPACVPRKHAGGRRPSCCRSRISPHGGGRGDAGAGPAAAGARPRPVRPGRSARVSAAPDVLRSLTSECVHCGFCLPTCPTYLLWSEEMDSPRGRIQLMEANLDGTISLNATVTQHFDACLGCMACVTACPSGVKYDRLIEATRETIETETREALRRPVRARRAVQAPPLPPPDGAGAAAGAARPQAAAAGAARRDDRDRAALALDRAARTHNARGWRDPRACRHSHRLRAVRGVRVGQRGHGAGTRSRRLRGRGAAAGLLRRPLDARRPRRRGACVRAAGDRGVRGRRDGGREHLGLRLAPEGARARARRRSRPGPSGLQRSRPASAISASSSRASSRAHRAIHST